jgi:hypothetical protein
MASFLNNQIKAMPANAYCQFRSLVLAVDGSQGDSPEVSMLRPSGTFTWFPEQRLRNKPLRALDLLLQEKWVLIYSVRN